MSAANAPASEPVLRIAVMGAGAVGCFFGALLARAGHAVVLIGRPAHVEAVRRDGLRLEMKGRDERLPMEASTEARAAQGADLVLFCVKSADTESAAAQLRPWLKPDTLLLSLQNGVDNAERLRAALPGQPVAAAVVYVATEMAGPGHVRHHGRGELVIEPARGGERVAGALVAAGIPTEVSAEVRAALWTKLVINCAYNALSAISQRPYGEVVRGEGVAQTMREIVAECRAVAQAEGVALPADLDERVSRLADSMPGQYSSTAQDLARGKPSEIDHLNGHVVRRGEALGVATPVNRALQALVKLLETRRAG